MTDAFHVENPSTAAELETQVRWLIGALDQANAETATALETIERLQSVIDDRDAEIERLRNLMEGAGIAETSCEE